MDGHDLKSLVPTLRNMLQMKGPRLLHIATVKGKGFAPAENDPVGYHAINKIETKEPTLTTEQGAAATQLSNGSSKQPQPIKYQQVFGNWLCETAAQDPNLIAITPAMCEGSGMVEFSQRFPERYYDVAIAEQHALTLAAGMATCGKKPVVAIYSTFLQRAYDQLIHDIALQNLCLLYTSPSPRDLVISRMPSSA